MKYIIGIDVGTGSLKALLYNTLGEFIYESQETYDYFSLSIGYSEQNPHDWYSAFIKVINDITNAVPTVKDNLEAISLGGQMHSLVLLDKDDKVIRPAILWNDVRNYKEVSTLNKNNDLILKSRNKTVEGFTLPKLYWIKNNEKNNWDLIDKILLPSSYISYLLTGEYLIDYSDASGTQMLDFDTADWNRNILNDLGISESNLPKVKWTTDTNVYVKNEIMSQLGLGDNRIRVFIGAADNAVTLAGSGISDKTTALISVGTSGVVIVPRDLQEFEYDDSFHFFHGALKETYYSMAVTLSAGNSLKWYVDTFHKGCSFEEVLKNINHIPVGSDNLLFAPYIMGERAPYTNANVRGAFINIDVNHNIDHFSRAILEGITFSLKDCFDTMQQKSNNIDKLISVGGAVKNKEWLQMQADIFNLPIYLLNSEQGAALGSVLIGLVGLGYDETASKIVNYSDAMLPIEKNVDKYRSSFLEYKKMYDKIK